MKRFPFSFVVVAVFSAHSCFAYGPIGHQIVGAVADERLANTPTGQKIAAMLDGLTLEKAAVVPDEIKGWDKKGADDPGIFHYSSRPRIDAQLRDFWKANPPTKDTKSPIPSHHWFHYTDVPVAIPEKYADGKAGRSKWDIVHMISYCVAVLTGEQPEQNERKITKPIAIILLAHYLGDIHQPLHVGAEYFDAGGQPVDPDRGKAGLEDQGGNTITLQLHAGGKPAKLHGFWDNNAVMALLPDLPPSTPKEERREKTDAAKNQIVQEFAAHEPANWKLPATIPMKEYGERWADEILPIAREAHERLQFQNIHTQQEENASFAAGSAIEKPPADHLSYLDWSAKTVRTELHKAGWRLADLLQVALAAEPRRANEPAPSSTPQRTAAPVVAPAPPAITAAAPTASPLVSASSGYGAFPSNYKQIIADWMKTHSAGANADLIEWQTEPKPAVLPGATGKELQGYLVIITTRPAGAAATSAIGKTHGILIRDGQVVSASGFAK